MKNFKYVLTTLDGVKNAEHETNIQEAIGILSNNHTLLDIRNDEYSIDDLMNLIAKSYENEAWARDRDLIILGGSTMGDLRYGLSVLNKSTILEDMPNCIKIQRFIAKELRNNLPNVNNLLENKYRSIIFVGRLYEINSFISSTVYTLDEVTGGTAYALILVRSKTEAPGQVLMYKLKPEIQALEDLE